MIDRTFYDGPDLIKRVPLIGIPLDPGKFTEVHVFIGISGTAFFRSAARILAVADILPFNHMDFGTAPFFAVGPSFFVTMPEMFHSEGRVVWVGGVTVKVISNLWKRAFIAYIIRDQGFGTMELIFQEAIGFDGVKG